MSNDTTTRPLTAEELSRLEQFAPEARDPAVQRRLIAMARRAESAERRVEELEKELKRIREIATRSHLPACTCWMCEEKRR